VQAELVATACEGAQGHLRDGLSAPRAPCQDRDVREGAEPGLRWRPEGHACAVRPIGDA